MLESWNIGKMGLGILQYWVNDKIRHDFKVKMDNFILKPNIPYFHYSIIPQMR
jgi:hypothetical protein